MNIYGRVLATHQPNTSKAQKGNSAVDTNTEYRPKTEVVRFFLCCKQGLEEDRTSMGRQETIRYYHINVFQDVQYCQHNDHDSLQKKKKKKRKRKKKMKKNKTEKGGTK